MAMDYWDVIEPSDDIPWHVQQYQSNLIRNEVLMCICSMARTNGLVLIHAFHDNNTYIAGKILNTSDQEKYRTNPGFRFSIAELVDAAIVDLHDAGVLEWITFAGGPAIYIPDAAFYLPGAGNKSSRIDELRSMPYPEYLQSPEWKERRDRHREHAGSRCQLCYGKGPLHVHHRTYERRGRERFSDLIVLCADCHKLFHQNKEIVRARGTK